MSSFGQTLFGGSRFVRWALTPFVLLFAILVEKLRAARRSAGLRDRE